MSHKSIVTKTRTTVCHDISEENFSSKLTAEFFKWIHEDKGDYNFFKQNHNTGYHKVQLELFFSQHFLYNSFFYRADLGSRDN